MTLRQDIHKQNVELAALRAQLAQAKELMREHEWTHDSDYCPTCKHGKPLYLRDGESGHTPDCAYAKFLEAE